MTIAELVWWINDHALRLVMAFPAPDKYVIVLKGPLQELPQPVLQAMNEYQTALARAAYQMVIKPSGFETGQVEIVPPNGRWCERCSEREGCEHAQSRALNDDGSLVGMRLLTAEEQCESPMMPEGTTVSRALPPEPIECQRGGVEPLPAAGQVVAAVEEMLRGPEG